MLHVQCKCVGSCHFDESVPYQHMLEFTHKQRTVTGFVLVLSMKYFLSCFLLLISREYVREVKVRLVKYLTSCPLSPNHAKEFFTMLLDEYQALSKAFDILRPFFSKLVSSSLHVQYITIFTITVKFLSRALVKSYMYMKDDESLV